MKKILIGIAIFIMTASFGYVYGQTDWTAGPEAGSSTSTSTEKWRWKTDSGDNNLDLEDTDNDVDVVTIEQGAPASSMTIEATTGSVIFNNGLTGTAASPSVAFGDGDTGFFESADGTLKISVEGTDHFKFNGQIFNGILTSAGGIMNETATATNPTIIPGNDVDTGLGWAEADVFTAVAGGLEAARFDSNGDITVARKIVLGTNIETIDTSNCEGNEDYVLKFNDTTDTISCEADEGGSGPTTPGGGDTEIQWNNSNALDGTNEVKWNDANTTIDFDNTGQATVEMGITFTDNTTASQYIKFLDDGSNADNFRKLTVASDLTDDKTIHLDELEKIHLNVPYLSPTENDVIWLGPLEHAWTVSNINCIVDPGGSSESVVIVVNECNSTGTSCATVDSSTLTCDNDGFTDASPTNATIDASDYMNITIGTVTGDVTGMNISINGSLDSE